MVYDDVLSSRYCNTNTTFMYGVWWCFVLAVLQHKHNFSPQTIKKDINNNIVLTFQLLNIQIQSLSKQPPYNSIIFWPSTKLLHIEHNTTYLNHGPIVVIAESNPRTICPAPNEPRRDAQCHKSRTSQTPPRTPSRAAAPEQGGAHPYKWAGPSPRERALQARGMPRWLRQHGDVGGSRMEGESSCVFQHFASKLDRRGGERESEDWWCWWWWSGVGRRWIWWGVIRNRGSTGSQDATFRIHWSWLNSTSTQTI